MNLCVEATDFSWQRELRHRYPTNHSLWAQCAELACILDGMRSQIKVLSSGRTWEEPSHSIQLEEFLLNDVSDGRLGYQTHRRGFSLTRSRALIRDVQRTYKMIEALYCHIRDMEECGLGTINLVDAGCGSLSLIAVVAALICEKIQAVGIEIDRASAERAERIVSKRRLNDRVNIVHGDARKYRHPTPIDLLVSETLYSGLTRSACPEPIAAILSRLAKQLHPEHGSIMPEWVSVDANVVSTRRDQWKQNPNIDEDSWRQILRWNTFETCRRIDCTLPLDTCGPHGIHLASRVGWYGDRIVLDRCESEITEPRPLSSPVWVPPWNRSLRIVYTPGDSLAKIRWKLFLQSMLTATIRAVPQIGAPQ